MLRHTSNFWSYPHQKKKGSSYQRVSANSRQGRAQQPVDLSPLDFYLWRHLKAFLYSPPNKNEDKLLRRIFYVCQTFRNHPGIFEGV